MTLTVLTEMMMMIMAVIIINVIMLRFSRCAVWATQDSVIRTANGEIMVMDMAVTLVHIILALQE